MLASSENQALLVADNQPPSQGIFRWVRGWLTITIFQLEFVLVLTNFCSDDISVAGYKK